MSISVWIHTWSQGLYNHQELLLSFVFDHVGKQFANEGAVLEKALE